MLSDAVIVVPAGDRRAQLPGRLLAEIVADHFGVSLPIVAGEAPAGRIAITVGEATNPGLAAAAEHRGLTVPTAAESYTLVVDATGAVVAGRDYRGALYGVSSLVQLVERWGQQSIALRRARIRDWPFLPVRWVHLYLPGRDQLGFARRYMRDFLLRHKYNGIVLEIGGGMRFDSHPEISTGWQRTVSEWYAHGETKDKVGEGIPLGTANRFAASLHVGVGGGGDLAKDDVRTLAGWAQDYGLEIIPEIQSLSHAYYIASARRDLAEDPDMRWPDSYCPSNPESYRVLFDLMAEILDVLRPRRVHIGHDEWRAGAFCVRCRGKDTGLLFAEDVLKIHSRLEAKGRASGAPVSYSRVTKRQSRATSLASTYLPISFWNCSRVFQGRYSSNSWAMRLPTPGMVMKSASVAVLSFRGMKTYCFSRSTSVFATYLPISLSNCAQLFQGRYSSNSCAMRRPAPGMSWISCADPVFRFTWTNPLP